MEYNIAVVEDEAAEAELLRSYFQQYSKEHGYTFHVRLFQDGRAFLTGYQPVYDLVLMDINLPLVNGLEAAAELRRLDQSVALIFVTSMARYAAKGYEVDAMDFILKPITYQNFSIKLQRVLRRCRQNYNPELLIHIKDGIYRISAARIKYIEITNHSLIYHTTEGDLSSSGNLKDVEAQLNSSHFIRCNRCYLVNLAFVRAVRGSILVVDTNELQISRPKRAAVLEALNNYLGGGV